MTPPAAFLVVGAVPRHNPVIRMTALPYVEDT